MSFYTILRQVYRALPERGMKRLLVGWVYRILHSSVVKTYTYEKDRALWRVVTREGITLWSLRDFDPAPLTDRELRSLQPGEYALDLGGNIGMVAIYMAYKVGPEGHVWVYEPDRENQKILQHHIEINGVKNVTLVPQGVWNKGGKLRFYEGGTYTSSFVKTNYIDQDPHRYQMTEIPVVALDDEYKTKSWKRLDFIKMDIEGSEIYALEGARQLLLELSPRLLIETHFCEGENTADKVKELLISMGYHVQEKAREEYPTLFAYKISEGRQK